MEPIKKLPADATQFEGKSGTIYTLEETLSVARYRMFERFRLEAGFGVTVPELIDILKQTLNNLELFYQGEKVLADTMALIHNTLKGVAALPAKEPYAIWLCTLFFNTADEDRAVFNEEVMRKKIQDWQGLDVSFFIRKACAMISDFSRLYDEITQMSLKWEAPTGEVWEEGQTDANTPTNQ